MRLPWGTVITGAFVVTLLRPVSWALGLAGFLAGGGIVLVAWPILVLPTPTGLQNALGGPVSSLVFGDPSPTLVALIVTGIAASLLLVLAGTLAGAWAERQGIAVALDAAAEDGLGLPAADLDGAPGAWRVAVVRLLGLAPVVIVAALAWRPFYDATYRQLVLPQDLVTPLPLRILGDVPWLVIAVAGAWLLSDAAAAVGVRRLVLDREPVLAAWLMGWGDLVRRPQRIIPTAMVGAAVLAVAGRSRRWWRRRPAGRACATSSSAAATRSSSPARSRSGSRSGWAVSCSRASGLLSGPRRTWTLEMPMRRTGPAPSPD